MIHICEGNVGEASADATHTYIIYEGTPSCGKERRQRAKLPAVRTTFLPPALAMRLPRAGNAIAKGRHIECPRLAHRVPSAGENPKALGNTIPSRWEHYSQGLGTLFPAAGNSIPSRGELDSQEPWENYNVHFCRSHTGEIDKNAKPRPPGGEASADECGAISGSHAAKRHGRPAPQKGRPTAKWKVKSREKRGWKMG